jgi:hypothetical protein
MTCLESLPLIVSSIGSLTHPEFYYVSKTWLRSWENNKQAANTRLGVLASPDDLLFLPPLDDNIRVRLNHNMCRVFIVNGAARTGKTEWLQRRLRRLVPDRPHVYIELKSDPNVSPQKRLKSVFAQIDRELGTEDAAHRGNAIISLDEPMRLLQGLRTDADLEQVANGLFQPFDNGLQPSQKPSHLFVADTNHFALPILLAAQAREGNEARDNANFMPIHESPHGGDVVFTHFFTICCHHC